MPVHDWTRVEAGIFHSFHSQKPLEVRFRNLRIREVQ